MTWPKGKGGVTSIAGGDYTYAYQAGGCTMVQDTSGVTGDASCPHE